MNRNRRPSEQSSEIKKNDLLRSDLFPKLIAIKTIVDQRRPDASVIDRLGRMVVTSSRAIIIGRRPLQGPMMIRNRPRSEMYPGYKELFKTSIQKGTVTVCQKRDQRREKLFAMGIAGNNKRQSPGNGGTYKRDENSEVVCRKVRR